MDAARPFLYFALLGPFVASLLNWLIGMYVFGDLSDSPGGPVWALIFSLLFALYVGFIPGLATGLVYSLLKTHAHLFRRHQFIAIVVTTTIGALACVSFVCVSVGVEELLTRDTQLRIVLPSVLGSVICAVLLESGAHRATA